MKKNQPKNWRRLTLSSVLLLALCSCNGPNPQTYFGSSTQASIEFYVDGVTTLQVEVITDTEEIKKLASFISKERTEYFKCGYDGRIVFTRKGKPEAVNFNMNPDCQHFSYIIDEELFCRKMTPEGLDYLVKKMEETAARL